MAASAPPAGSYAGQPALGGTGTERSSLARGSLGLGRGSAGSARGSCFSPAPATEMSLLETEATADEARATSRHFLSVGELLSFVRRRFFFR